jgi:hypothetical protein
MAEDHVLVPSIAEVKGTVSSAEILFDEERLKEQQTL